MQDHELQQLLKNADDLVFDIKPKCSQMLRTLADKIDAGDDFLIDAKVKGSKEDPETLTYTISVQRKVGI